jgi:hypothetical protein
MERTVKVSVNGETQERRVVGFETNRDIAMDTHGLDALNQPVTMVRPIPETFEGEKVYWTMDGSCFIVMGLV